MITKIKLLSSLIVILFFNINCMQDKVEFENKSECEDARYEKSEIYNLKSKYCQLKSICKLTNRRIAILRSDNAQSLYKINVLNIDSGKKEQTIKFADKKFADRPSSLINTKFEILEITNNKLVVASCLYAFQSALNGPGYTFDKTCVRIFDLNKFFSKKITEIIINPDHRDHGNLEQILYLNTGKLLLIIKNTIFILNLDSNIITKKSYHFEINHIKQLADGDFVCYSKHYVIFLDSNLEIIESNPIINPKYLQTSKDKKSFTVLIWGINYRGILKFNNEKYNFAEIKKNLNNKISVPDLQNLILDYLGTEWEIKDLQENGNQDNYEYLESFHILPNNKIINIVKHKTDEFIQLWTESPLKHKHTLDITRCESHFVIFEDATIIRGNQKIEVYKPVQNSRENISKCL